MKNIIEKAPKVANAFWNLTKEITEVYEGDLKNKELILVGMFAVSGMFSGLETHIQRAVKEGASEDEIVSTILLGIPVVGICRINQAINIAMNIIKGENDENN